MTGVSIGDANPFCGHTQYWEPSSCAIFLTDVMAVGSGIIRHRDRNGRRMKLADVVVFGKTDTFSGRAGLFDQPTYSGADVTCRVPASL